MAALERLWYLSKYLIFLPLLNFNLLVSIWGRTRSGSDFVFWVKYLNILFCGLCWARIKVSVVLFRGYILVSEQTFLHYGVFVYQHILWHRFSIWKISKTNTIKFSSCHGPQKIKFSHKKLICSLPWPEQLEVELETNLRKDWSFPITDKVPTTGTFSWLRPPTSA